LVLNNFLFLLRELVKAVLFVEHAQRFLLDLHFPERLLLFAFLYSFFGRLPLLLGSRFSYCATGIH
jgi:hypothetical protein